MLFSNDKIPFPAENAEICIKRIPKYTSSDVYFFSQSLTIPDKFQKLEMYGGITPLVAKNLWDNLVESYRTEIKYLVAIRFQKRSLSDDSLTVNVAISFQLAKSTYFHLKETHLTQSKRHSVSQCVNWRSRYDDKKFEIEFRIGDITKM